MEAHMDAMLGPLVDLDHIEGFGRSDLDRPFEPLAAAGHVASTLPPPKAPQRIRQQTPSQLGSPDLVEYVACNCKVRRRPPQQRTQSSIDDRSTID